MPHDFSDIDGAKSWTSYYQAYIALYRELVTKRWCLGKVSVAGHIHHTVIPDVAGRISGSVNWAAYSQHSAETLLAFLGEFRETLLKEPHRLSTNRYLFFCLRSPKPGSDEVRKALMQSNSQLIYTVLSFEEQLSHPEWMSPIDSAVALKAISESYFAELRSHWVRSDHAPRVFLKSIAEFSSGEISAGKMSLTDQLILDSSVLLSAFSLRLAHSDVVEILGQRSSIAALLAGQRAKDSDWGVNATDYMVAVSELMPASVATYRVQTGDILSRIVRERYGVPFERLWPIIRALNPQIADPNKIVAGKDIRLPKF